MNRSPMVAILKTWNSNFIEGHRRSDYLHLDANKLVTQLIAQKNCCIMFDSTDALHANHDFWDWLEDNLLIPLVEVGSVRLVFAGTALCTLHPASGTRPVRIFYGKRLSTISRV